MSRSTEKLTVYASAMWLMCLQMCLAQAPGPVRVYHETIHQGAIYGLTFALNDQLVCSCGNDRRVVVTVIHEREITAVERQKREQWLIDLDSDKFQVRQWAYENLLRVGPSIIPRLKEHIESLLTVTIDGHDGKKPRVRVESREALARTESLLRQLTVEPKPVHTRDIRGMALSPDGGTLWTVARDNSLCRWTLPAGRPQQKYSCHTDGAWAVTCSPNNRWVASGGGDYMVQLWDAQTGKKIERLAGHQKIVHGVAFSPDSRWLASSGGFDRTIRIWNPTTAQLVATIDDTREAILRVLFSGDGKYLFSAGYGNVVMVHDSLNWQPAHSLETSIAVVRGLAVSPNGKWLAIGGNHSKIEIWSTKTFAREIVLAGFSGNVNVLAFAHTRNELAAGDSEGSISVWRIPVDD